MKTKGLKTNNHVFKRRMITLMVIVSLICMVLNIGANMMEATIDTYVGAGEKYVSGDSQGLDGNYYQLKYATAEEAKDAAYAVANQVAEEGSILLKNNGILPLEKGEEIMPFGYAYLNPIYGQLSSGGSAKWVVDPVTPEMGLSTFKINMDAVECMENAQVEELLEADGTKAAGKAGSVLGGDCKIYEYNSSIYDELEENKAATGLVLITRSGQEGQDQKHDAYSDGTPHYLALSENEKGAIKAAKKVCGKVVVILISSAPLEMGELISGDLEADAILWMGHPGEKGFCVLSDILDGQVNPSGKTVDIWAADFTADPSYQSIGEYRYSNHESISGGYSGTGAFNTLYNEYMEGMYMGYRYYETAAECDENFEYDEAVCFPFGYGLSYTSFEKKLEAINDDGKTITARVKVTNVGAVAGKEVVEIYYNAPYTELDKEYKIEKPLVNLVGFTKTEELEPGESQIVEVKFSWEDMASYCYTHENSDGSTGCYMLEEGEYIISLRENSHEEIAEEILTRGTTIWYDGSDEDHIRSTDAVVATNLFQTSSDYMNENSTLLTRKDWTDTFPQGAEGHTKEIEDKFASLIGIENTFDPINDETFGNVEGSIWYSEEAPVSGAENGLLLSDLRGADYNDERWELLLDQIDWSKDKEGILQNFTGDAYLTAAIESIGLPSTVDEDGANGLKVNGMTNDGSGYDMNESSSFGFAPLMAATWNVELMYKVGESFGQESLQNGINGWYAPAINLHRSMFSGRVFEYLSEDPVLSGYMAAFIMSGAGDQGMYCYLKHFALNETETGRAELICTWADEQTMRELYFKAFEIAIKNAKMSIKYYDEEGNMQTKEMNAATAIMAAQDRVGYVVGECNYPLLQSLLRDEWGFEGMVISDYWVWNGNNLRDLAVRSGCDTYLCMYMSAMWSLSDYDSIAAKNAMRQAIKNISYAVVNSNAMQNIAPGQLQKQKISPWKIGLIINDIIVVLLLAGAVVLIMKRSKDAKMHPENYKPRRKSKKEKTIRIE